MFRRNKLLLGIIVAVVVLFGMIVVMPTVESEFFNDDWTIILTAIIPYAVCMTVALALKPFTQMRIPTLKPKLSVFNAFFTLSGVVLMFATQIIVSPLTHFIPNDYHGYLVDFVPIIQQSGFYPQLTAIILLPIAQEWVFRGIFQKNIEARFGPIIAIFASAVLFAVTFIVPADMVYMLGPGIAIAAIYYTTKSLSTVIWIHMLFNGINYLMYMFFDVVISWYKIFEGNIQNYIIAWTVSAIIVIVTAWWVSNHYDKRLFFKKSAKN